MVFNSGVFIYFLIVVLAVYFGLARLPAGHKWQNRFLLVASWFFYGWWDWLFLVLIGISTIIDYIAARAMGSDLARPHRRLWMSISLIVNLGMLGIFKYYDFFIESFIHGMSLLAPGWQAGAGEHLLLKVALPVGISFYTFQTLSYTIDVYRGQIEAERDFWDFALFVSFFPQLVAGPIERAGQLLPQIKQVRTVRWSDWQAGAWMFLYGFFLKTVVADSIAPWVDSVFLESRAAWLAHPDYLQYISAPHVLFACIGFAIQIYGDFAGYSFIALGSARLLGIELTLNFDVPLYSRNPVELWRRWHVTLNRWLTDYVYITFGGSRYGELRKYRNLFFVFLLTGLWHGASWTFVAWGAYMGIWMLSYMVLSPWLQSRSGSQRPWMQVPGQIIMTVLCFLGFALSALFFRAWDIQQSWQMLTLLLNWPLDLVRLAFSEGAEWVTLKNHVLGISHQIPDAYRIAAAILQHSWLVFAMEFFWRKENDPWWIFHKPFGIRLLVYAGLYFLILLTGVFGKNVIYFAF
ncbi:MAG: MBOAT family protein [Leptospiraceae bacterium]|nr:MBOAT family protein [Leptospiraceae bacterium]